MLAFVQFRANSKRLKTGLGHLGVKPPKRLKFCAIGL